MFKPNCRVTLFRRNLLPDGSSSIDGGTGFDAFFMEHYRTLKDGTSEDHSEVLLGPDAYPIPGDTLEINGVRRTIARVRNCTDVRGTVRCCRCTFLRS